jgi:dTDP-4-amino-4,6-dideoxygalactose transaminase
MAAFSFHETKNIVSGEGGALVINNPRFNERAEIIREKGTNRSRFFRGEVDKYTWVDIGSSYLPSELIAAFLFAQLQHIDEINKCRMAIWQQYEVSFNRLAAANLITMPSIPEGCIHNAHLFYILTNSHQEQVNLLAELKKDGVGAVFHYVPLHNSDAGEKFGRVGSTMVVTDELANRLVRLPIYPDLTADELELICQSSLRHIVNIN